MAIQPILPKSGSMRKPPLDERSWLAVENKKAVETAFLFGASEMRFS
jgi:hypothetical protein